MLSTIEKMMLAGVFYLSTITCTPLFTAEHGSKKSLIMEGSYDFHASYKLSLPSLPSKLIVKMKMFRGMNCTRALHGKIISPDDTSVYLECIINDHPSVIEIQLPLSGKYKITKMDIPSSSVWHTALQELAKRVGKYYAVKEKKTSEEKCCSKTHFPSSIRIKPLRRYAFSAQDAVAFPHWLFHPQLPRTISVSITIDSITNSKGKKVLTVIASFYKKERPFDTDLRSTIKFVKTKNGLREISRKRISQSSMLYENVKKIVKKNMKQYLRFKKIHKKIANRK